MLAYVRKLLHINAELTKTQMLKAMRFIFFTLLAKQINNRHEVSFFCEWDSRILVRKRIGIFPNLSTHNWQFHKQKDVDKFKKKSLLNVLD